MAKIKNNKIKNVGIMFELLIRQIAKDILNEKKHSAAVKILNENFRKGNELSREYVLYKSVIDNKGKLKPDEAKYLIDEICDNKKKLNENKLKKEKFNLVRDIKKNYDLKDFLKSEVEDYRILASIFKILESKNDEKQWTNPNDILQARKTIIEYLTNPVPPKKKDEKISKLMEEYMSQDKDVRLLAYKIFLNKYNEKYKVLNEDQKNLLRRYINRISNSNSLNEYITKEFERIKPLILHEAEKETDDVLKIKLKEIAAGIDKILEKKKFNEEKMEQLMHYYELLEELKNR